MTTNPLTPLPPGFTTVKDSMVCLPFPYQYLRMWCLLPNCQTVIPAKGSCTHEFELCCASTCPALRMCSANKEI